MPPFIHRTHADKNQPEVFKVFLNQYNGHTRAIDFPDGRSVVITPSEPYLTDDKQEIEWISKNCRYLAIVKADEKEVRNYTYNPENLPRIISGMQIDENTIERWKWSPSAEKKLAILLKHRGYQVAKLESDYSREVGEENEIKRMIERLNTLGYKVLAPKEAEIEDAKKSQLTPENLSDKSYKDLKDIYTKMGGHPIGISKGKLIELISSNVVEKKKEAGATTEEIIGADNNDADTASGIPSDK